MILLYRRYHNNGKNTYTSYNLQAWNNGKDLVYELRSLSDVILIREHWLYPSTLHKLEDGGDAHTVFASSSMNDDEIHSVRPYGGLAILVNDKLLSFYKYIGHSDDNRCLAMMVQCKDMQLFLFNVYFLCFMGPDMYDSDIMHVIGFLENVLLENISAGKKY